MLHKNPAEFLKSIPKDKRVMCLDMGKKQIGIAFSDKTQLIATAHSIYNRKNISKDLGYLNRVFKENEAGSVVIGLPLETNRKRSEWYETIIQFATKMIKKYKVNIYLQDESLSTFIAIHTLKTAGVSITKSKKIDDKISACIILQRTLDKINTIK
ncbi:Holliday junction resolvase RuvX [Wolbachia endosymbiont of Onchocerca gibsoni]|uniref:Holliday junction resolvase RuvX n=1 Tax=Wolbachia endosymbiont of Onchocerca gibsoni TaxID=118986 RepID=UPI0023D7C39F|nr:Holliday junction resolvase RuvX [Wolbachia endosymbiont of Onchocerca gibsoni]MDF0607802.1 Holliday junction resolvase RuvX [Wolbachia endosymbiont of Onchocerca gibsoni]